MILSVGELLADVIESAREKNVYDFFCGGAPFNVAVNVKLAGGSAGFIGRVGSDPVGRFLADFASSVNLDYCNIQEDTVRNTTLAFVSLNNGERDFAFFRHDTADFNIDLSNVDFSTLTDLNVVHVGSLMLSELVGQRVATELVNKTKSAGKLLSFDVNYRADVFRNIDQAKAVYEPLIDNADILKFSEDELELFTGESDLQRATDKLLQKDKLILVTLGSKGAYYRINNLQGIVPSQKVTPIDTTGAGDAFFGTALSQLDGVCLSTLQQGQLKQIITKANFAGAMATQHKGAINL